MTTLSSRCTYNTSFLSVPRPSDHAVSSQGYEEMASKYGLTELRRVRGDNYCAVRAALYQLLARGLPPPNANRCRRLLAAAGDWVTGWSFGSRLPYDETTARAGIQDCLGTLTQLVRAAGHGAVGHSGSHHCRAAVGGNWLMGSKEQESRQSAHFQPFPSETGF